jgi:hypothetical protein
MPEARLPRTTLLLGSSVNKGNQPPTATAKSSDSVAVMNLAASRFLLASRAPHAAAIIMTTAVGTYTLLRL